MYERNKFIYIYTYIYIIFFLYMYFHYIYIYIYIYKLISLSLYIYIYKSSSTYLSRASFPNAFPKQIYFLCGGGTRLASRVPRSASRAMCS